MTNEGEGKAETKPCDRCHGKRYVLAPADNDWVLYFKRAGQGSHAVFVGCPKCNVK